MVAQDNRHIIGTAWCTRNWYSLGRKKNITRLDTELSRLLIDKLTICNLKLLSFGYRTASSWGGRGSLGIVEAKEATIPKTLEAGEEIPLRSIHQHSGKESFQLVGLLLNKRRLYLSGESASIVQCPCSFSSRTTLSSNPLIVQLFLQIITSLDCALLNYNKINAINSSTLSK